MGVSISAQGPLSSGPNLKSEQDVPLPTISAEEYGYEDDSDLEDDESSLDDMASAGEDLNFEGGDISGRHIAFKTWRAFLFFLYTEKNMF